MAGHTERLMQRLSIVRNLVEHHAEECDVKRAIGKRKLFRWSQEKRSVRHMLFCRINHFPVDVDTRDTASCIVKGLGKYGAPRAHIQERLDVPTFEAYSDNPLDFEAGYPFRRPEFVGPLVEYPVVGRLLFVVQRGSPVGSCVFFALLPDTSTPISAPYPVLIYGLELMGQVPVEHPTK